MIRRGWSLEFPPTREPPRFRKAEGGIGGSDPMHPLSVLYFKPRYRVFAELCGVRLWTTFAPSTRFRWPQQRSLELKSYLKGGVL